MPLETIKLHIYFLAISFRSFSVFFVLEHNFQVTNAGRTHFSGFLPQEVQETFHSLPVWKSCISGWWLHIWHNKPIPTADVPGLQALPWLYSEYRQQCLKLVNISCRTAKLNLPSLCRKIKQMSPIDMLTRKRVARTCLIPKLMKKLSSIRKLNWSYTRYCEVQIQQPVWVLAIFIPPCVKSAFLHPTGCVCGILEWVASV